ncbi:RagB/SusD family nutrient uptake outer membrane protein [Palleniella muris]|uniref:RagB/SusD family nutrient uptake outer membrane protein n=1 Tax=Palleniella muris TaxID=3038145 RepID=A0AC61QM56_9BACT|nr:RagB/SusD family nutrient uptake outer membrane protein [Palleniella muris]TGX80209.1 RagB/SusD family nutrient uptake outer membrane protein [Palleniella muris]
MKLKNIFLAGVSVLALSSCNDFLDVDAPSSATEEFVFSQKSEITRALNGVYAQAIVGDLYGNAYQSKFIYNSDVDMQISSNSAHEAGSFARFDCDYTAGDINKLWKAAYNLIEYANKFIASAEQSIFYKNGDSDVVQQVGEAKCLRAMAYHDLVVMFGDVPFFFAPASEHGSEYVPPVADRLEIQKALINDLKVTAPTMASSGSVTVEHCSKEFAYALIARIALTAGGYSLYPDKNDVNSYGEMKRPDNYEEFYEIARDNAYEVISAGTHKLVQDYQDVFVNECNYQVVNNDDVIFELPFAKESTGNTGYIQGPTYSAYEGSTVGPWGEAKGSGRLNAFYRFLFRDKDLRREFVNGLWYYSYFQNSDGAFVDSVYVRNDYTVHNNKWSKLWTAEGNALGSKTSGSTGINFPYMRYADVLLMYAEAANELNNGPTDEAVKCLEMVHNRAFADGDPTFIAEAKTSKEAFQKAVLDERKWEFAGENSRWRDLVRTNTYSRELIYSFLRYYSVGMQNAGSGSGYEDAINTYDGKQYIDNLPERIYYHSYKIEEANERAFRAFAPQLYGYQISGTSVLKNYPNQSLKSLRIYNAYERASREPTKSLITVGGFTAPAWEKADFYQWGDTNNGIPRDQCLYSFYGFIRGDINGNVWLVKNGTLVGLPSNVADIKDLPAVRYILPYPQEAIQRSAGVYKNYYGYK